MSTGLITASVISRPGNWGDDTYTALEISVDGVRSPFVMAMQLSRVSAKAVAEQIDLDAMYAAIERAVNEAAEAIDVRNPKC